MKRIYLAIFLIGFYLMLGDRAASAMPRPIESSELASTVQQLSGYSTLGLLEQRVLRGSQTAPTASPATTYTVTSTSDSTAVGTLRKSIFDANVNPGADIIVFNIPMSDPGYNAATGVWTISLGGTLPAISDPVTIDATTQPGYAGTPRIELNGTNVNTDLMVINGGNSVVRGLAINRAAGWGLKMRILGGNIVEANFIGTDASGTIARGNGSGGIFIDFSSNNVIGGSTIGAVNLISGNLRGVLINDTSNNNKIQGNVIGPAADGTGGIGNSVGIQIRGSDNNVIGVAADGTGAGNIIAYNPGGGVSVISAFNVFGTGNRISRNSIFINTPPRIGIDLGALDSTPNDPGDADTGPNNLQNYPVLTAASSNNASTTIEGTLNSTPNTSFSIEFFSSRTCAGHGETFIGSRTVTTDGGGNVSFTGTNSVTFPVGIANGQVITTTATDMAGNTSEFSACVTVINNSPTPTPTPPASPVPVSGRVITSDGRGLRNATVSITDSNGIAQTTTTSSFGFYSFENVLTGGTYTIRVSSRLFRFAPRTLQVTGSVSDVDFIGLE